MHATLALCLLAASALAVSNATPSVGGANLQDKELRNLMKRLQTNLETFKKNVRRQGGEPSGQPAGDDGGQQTGGADKVPDTPSGGSPDETAISYVIDLAEKATALGNANSELYRAYGGQTADSQNAPDPIQQVIIRKEMLDLLTEMEYELVALQLLGREPPSDEVSQACATLVGGKRGQAPLPLRSPSGKATAKESRTAGKPVNERKTLMGQRRKFLAKTIGTGTTAGPGTRCDAWPFCK